MTEYLNKHLLALGFVLIIAAVSADIDQYNINYNIPAGSSEPNIISWSNSKTNDNNQNINIGIGETIKFNITADQSIGTWKWSKDGIIQTNNYDNFTTSWSTIGNKIISVNGSNINGTTSTIIWNIAVLNQTIISACGTLNIANSVYVLNSSVSSSGTCFVIGTDNITLEGQGNTVNYASTGIGYGISDSGGYDNIILRNLTLKQENAAVTGSYGIYLRNVINSRADNISITTKNDSIGLYLVSSSSNQFSGCNITTINGYGLILSSSNSNYFSDCNITTTGNNANAFYLLSSNYNNYSGANIFTSGGSANGIWINTNGNNNNFSNVNILAGASGVKINSANSNIIKNSSVISKLFYDYYLADSMTNNFINTNLTTRKIDLNDNKSIFNYANNNIMLNTNQTVSPTSTVVITRTLVNWAQTNVTWRETVDIARRLNYGMSGLLPNTIYSVWNGSVISYNLTTDVNGNLPDFSINLTATAKTIKVVPS